MKKIFFMAVTAILLAAGCQKTEIQNETKTPIGFNSQMGKLTKAHNAANEGLYDNLFEQGFRVWGFFASSNDINYELNEDYFDGIIEVKGKKTVTGEGEAAKTTYEWFTEDIYYWPGKGKELNLYAVSSYEEDYNLTATGNVEITHATTDASAKMVIKDFVVDANADNDLMVAALIKQDQDDDKYVKPHFQHMLTKVVLKFAKSGDSDVHVISAVTSSIPSTSTLTITHAEPNEPEENKAIVATPDFQWGDKTVAIAYEAQNTLEKVAVPALGEDGVNSTTHNAVALNDGFQTFGSWLLLPQDVVDDTYYLDVEYIVDGQYIKQRFNLNAGNVTKWDRNQMTTYKVTISPDYIQFTPDVQDWADEKTQTDEFDN